MGPIVADFEKVDQTVPRLDASSKQLQLKVAVLPADRDHAASYHRGAH